MAEAPRRWILLRGLGREAGHWADMTGELQAAFPSSEIVALDLPGAGTKWKQKSPIRLSEIAGALFAEAGPGPNALIGLSLGAMVALQWAADFPDSVERIVVMNTSLRTVAHPLERFTAEALLRSVKAGIHLDVIGRERAILELTSNSEKRRKEVLPEWVRISREHPVSAENWVRQIAAAAGANPSLKAITAPGLVLASRGDRLCRYRCSERLARRLNWPLRLHETSGHDLPLDDPQWIVRQITDWLR